MTTRVPRTALIILAIVVVLGGAILFAVYRLLQQAEPYVRGENCQITTPDGTIELDIEQSQVAAVIAAVAARRKLPERALEIAYITAIQESKLSNIPYGDRDSVGIFQQRPSQGWGTVKQLMDPVYSTRKFFAALEKVEGYLDLPLHDAAQEVQRSADGGAYADHRATAIILAGAFSGRVASAVYCWYPPPAKPVKADPGEARGELTRALGAAARKDSWLVATWYVTHAQKYGLRQIRYDGVSWTAENGHDGWQADKSGKSGPMAVS
ncbi:hypothetical protein Aph01nite_55990 [Acrocarpospora phusangensis]|uniref:Uncharacterized protein n=1 Tax=Acrocarpospora phusangensis TaxID=1070424 RepID=A0A919UMV2_9ACTN|nr:hypothetical protein [Acrocarpospora phusangensis]GIH27289.1 hypothetical protein Aph01nite_55990 [Acrocarpospora phusangensis]